MGVSAHRRRLGGVGRRLPRPSAAAGIRRAGTEIERGGDLRGALHIGRRKRSHDVAEQIERLIRSGEFRAGEHLPSEAELTKLLKVGRPSVREALFMLQFRGLVEITNGARAKATTPTPDFLIGRLSDVAMTLASLADGQRHLEQTRLIFESGLAWLAAQNATPEDIARLQDALSANVAAMGDTTEFIRTDVAFHYELARIARNPIFNAFHNVLVEWLIDQRTTTINMPEADKLSVRDHTAIFEAVAVGDPARAYHEMASHLRLISRLYEEATRLHETLMRKVTRDIAASTGKENEEIWRASFTKDPLEEGGSGDVGDDSAGGRNSAD
jgi:GntR family transcriptional regulator, sialic acid-inducible nan operon repressor